jgi:hypothetical protein
MKQIDANYIFEKWFKDLQVEDTDNPIQMSNLILDKDMRQQGNNWVEGSPRTTTIKKIFAIAPQLSFMVGDYIRENLEEAEKKTQEEAPPETNTRDPRIFSSNPQFNGCPGYLNGVCRVNGRPCTWSNFNKNGEPVNEYTMCGVYHLAQSGDPALFTIEPGMENSQWYALGNKA